MFISRPTGLKASRITFKSVRVDWNPVPESFILGFRVLVKNIPLDETFPWNKTYADITGLRGSTKYIISVLPVHGLTDKKYFTENTGSIIVTTKQEPGEQFQEFIILAQCLNFLLTCDLLRLFITFGYCGLFSLYLITIL